MLNTTFPYETLDPELSRYNKTSSEEAQSTGTARISSNGEKYAKLPPTFVAVAGASIDKDVSLRMETTRAPDGMPSPKIDMPTRNAPVDATCTVALPFVVPNPKTVPLRKVSSRTNEG
jgi:hypothetical protein